MEDIGVHLLLVGGLRAIVSPDKAIGYDIVIDPVENLLFEDAASLIQGDAIGSQPLVFVEDVGIKTYGQAERFEERPGLCEQNGVVPVE